MVETPSLNADSTAVQAHLTITQGVIQRMAENSRSCKVWCVTLVSAGLILVARTGEPQHALLALVPTFLFCILDAYYLALERAFRNSYSEFVRKLHCSEGKLSDLYEVRPTGMGLGLVSRCLGSVSIWLFYPLVAVTILAAWWLIIPSDTMNCDSASSLTLPLGK